MSENKGQSGKIEIMSREEMLIDIQSKNDIRNHNTIDKYQFDEKTGNLLIKTHIDGNLYFLNNQQTGRYGSIKKEELQKMINESLDSLTVRINLDIHIVPIDNVYNIEILTKQYLIYHKENLFQYEDFVRQTEQEMIETRCHKIQLFKIYDVLIALRSAALHIWQKTMNLKYYKNPAVILKSYAEFNKNISEFSDSQIIELNRSLTTNYDIYMSLYVDFQKKFNLKK